MEHLTAYTGFDFEEFDTPMATSEHVAEFLLCKDNDSALTCTARMFARDWEAGELEPSWATWCWFTQALQEHRLLRGVVDWQSIDKPVLFTAQVFTWMAWKQKGQLK